MVTKRLFACVVSALLMAGCGADNEPNDGRKVVNIGHVGPLTGPSSHVGKDNERGAGLAVDEANQSSVVIGGEAIKFRLISEDDEANPQKATVVAQRLVDADVAGVVGHLNSGTTIPASTRYYEAGIPQISPSATAIKYTRQGYETAYRVMANDEQQGKVLGDYAVKTLGAKGIAIIDDRSAYGAGLADEFESAVKEAGGKILAREFTDITKVDFTAILTKIKGIDADLIFYGGMDAQAGPMMKQMKNLGLTAIFLGGDGIRTRQFTVLSGAESEGVYASTPGLPVEQMAGGTEFREKYKQVYREDIQLYAPYAYDATSVMIDAMKRANSVDPATYLPFLRSTDFKGVTGRIRFDERGDLKGGGISLYRVTNGAWKYIETIGGGE
ncbi:MAG: branched-chain amino acid ABC transporter substrate-binding protein [Proteobacteria bacterium]|nr:branched-chain amino acid ABC transporter substrate-binding protein [Pseudomonadota bacterium]MDA1011075.1 branched-chain amino acid ABC transporter substrate-binding protein [Pseudomonadota bacterium]